MLRAIDGLTVSLIAWWPVRALVLVATVLVGLLLLRYARRATSIMLAMVLFAGFVTADLMLAQNAYYGTYPTVRAWVDDAPVTVAEPPPSVPQGGQTMPVRIPGERSGFAARPALVHLPQAWFGSPRPALPVVMLLHASPGAPQEWVDPAAAATAADAWAQRNGGVAPILVIPDVTGEAGLAVCADTATGNVETYLTGDVPAFLQSRFGSAPAGPGWAVVGHGNGGACALAMALRHQDLFPTVATFGATAGGPDPAHDPVALLTGRTYPGTSAWLADTDPPSGAAAQLVPLARAAGVAACQIVRPGVDPGLSTWGSEFATALPWLAARVGQVPDSPATTAGCAPLTS